MSKQDQQVEGGGSAIQAGRDVVIQNMSASQMSEIMIALAGQLQKFVAQAEDTFVRRCDALRESILSEFSKSESIAKPEAFGDPDFQFAIKAAQQGFGRSGDEELQGRLVSLLAQRSAEPIGSRRSKALNEAIQLASNLSNQEYALLVAIFMIKYARVNHDNYEGILSHLDKVLEPFVADFPHDQHAGEYLEAMRATSQNQLLSHGFWDQLSTTYDGLFTGGFTSAELELAISDQATRAILSGLLAQMGGFYDVFTGAGQKYRFALPNRAELEQALLKKSATAEQQAAVLNFFDANKFSVDKVQAIVRSKTKVLPQLAEHWSASGASRISLTTLGKILSHSSLSARSVFDAPLDVWVK